MTQYLLALSIGPVQEFIAAARRTSDLYAGSQLLSQVVGAVVEQLSADGAVLILPADKKDSAANKILVEVSVADNQAIAALVEKLKQAAREKLNAVWIKSYDALRPMQKQEINNGLARQQICGLLEIYAAWLPVAENDYSTVRQELEKLLAGRKALRDFAQTDGIVGNAKSLLDPTREAVVEKVKEHSPLMEPPLRLQKGECLDGVSLLKRVYGITKSDTVPSTSKMAARYLKSRLADQKAYNDLEQAAKNSGLDIGDVLFRLDQSTELSPDKAKALSDGRRMLLEEAKLSQPIPYYAILAADGDRMGKLLNDIHSADDHRTFSQKLSGFAESAKEIVREQDGFCIYAGGDDVLALLPLHTAIVCASKLAKTFAEQVPSGTLSVGVAIVHHLESLQEAVEYARKAEKAAKDSGRDSLAVALHTRGGSPLTSCAKWNGDVCKNDWEFWIKTFQEELSRGVPYELAQFAREIKNMQPALSSDTLLAEVKRIVGRKEGGKAFLNSSTRLDTIADAKALEALARQMTIARFLAKPEAK